MENSLINSCGDILPPDYALSDRIDQWTDLLNKYDKNDNSKLLSENEEESACNLSSTDDEGSFVSSEVGEMADNNIENLKEKLVCIADQRKMNWKNKQKLNLLNPFNFNSKVNDWFINTEFGIMNSFEKKSERICYKENTRNGKINTVLFDKQQKIQISKSIDSESDSSVDTAKYILSNRNRGERSKFTIIKKYSIIKSRNTFKPSTPNPDKFKAIRNTLRFKESKNHSELLETDDFKENNVKKKRNHSESKTIKNVPESDYTSRKRERTLSCVLLSRVSQDEHEGASYNNDAETENLVVEERQKAILKRREIKKTIRKRRAEEIKKIVQSSDSEIENDERSSNVLLKKLKETKATNNLPLTKNHLSTSDNDNNNSQNIDKPIDLRWDKLPRHLRKIKNINTIVYEPSMINQFNQTGDGQIILSFEHLVKTTGVVAARFLLGNRKQRTCEPHLTCTYYPPKMYDSASTDSSEDIIDSRFKKLGGQLIQG